MKKILLGALMSCSLVSVFAQPAADGLEVVKKIDYTPVKNQSNTGTCWSFATTSFLESTTMKGGFGEFDLSEMYTVRCIYTEKAKNYILRQGSAQFGPGGLGHDVTHAMAAYGAVPESVYSGLLLGKKTHDHNKLDARLKTYLDSLLKVRPLPKDWMKGFQNILDEHLGKAPETFMFQERQYTPQSFAKDVLHYNADDYVNITSFTHHPFYASFVLEVPDNYSNGLYYNIPLDEMMKLTTKAVESGYSVSWDADVSSKNFNMKMGYAMLWSDNIPMEVDPDATEATYSQAKRQELFENLTTQDDHLMHLVGIEKSKNGKKFFLVKNSWGEVGPYKGFINVSESYFAINTISLVVPKAALDKALLAKLGIK